MALTPASISKVQFSGTFAPETVSPLTEALSVILPLTFGSVANLVVQSGTVTPENAIINLTPTFSSAADAPTFIILLVDGQFNLSTTSATTDDIQEFPVQRFLFVNQVPVTANYIQAITCDGRTVIPNPMPQGTPVNYTLIYGQATIT